MAAALAVAILFFGAWDCKRPPTRPRAATAARASTTASADPARAQKVCKETLPESAPLDDARIAALVLDGYSATEHRVPTLPRPAGTDAGAPFEFGVRSCGGEVVWTQSRSPDEAPGTVRVVTRSPDDWARGMRLAWITVGAQPGLCTAEQGFLVLVSREKADLMLVALTPWEGSCRTDEHAVRFVTAGGEHLILEADGDTGEDPRTESWDRVWLFAGPSLRDAGNLRTAFEETREPWLLADFQRSMSASVDASPKGLVVHETWHFMPRRAGRRPVDRHVERVLGFAAGRLVNPSQPDPRP